MALDHVRGAGTPGTPVVAPPAEVDDRVVPDGVQPGLVVHAPLEHVEEPGVHHGAGAGLEPGAEKHVPLRQPRQLTRFLCGLSSPAATRARLSRHDHYGVLETVPFQTVLAQVETMLL